MIDTKGMSPDEAICFLTLLNMSKNHGELV
jgi:hypothetical protein